MTAFYDAIPSNMRLGKALSLGKGDAANIRAYLAA